MTYGFPYIDLDAGGSIDGMIDALEKVMMDMPKDVKIIPGHGPVCGLEEMRVFDDAERNAGGRAESVEGA